ncbi:MAG: glycosyltransferase family 4 protein, partial [bacterium]
MKILFVSQYFPPEVNAPANRVSELALEWARMGHDVTVLTGFPNHPLGVKRREDRGVLTRRETIDGVKVVRCYLWATPNRGIAKRMFSYATFMKSAIFFGALRCSKPDVIIATSPQLLTGVSGYALSLRFRAPFVFEVRDLWPESILAVGAMRNNPFIKVLQRLAAFLYRHCAQIVTVGEGYKRQIVERYRIDAGKISVIENGVHPQFFQPLARDPAFAAEVGWTGKKVLLYAG